MAALLLLHGWLGRGEDWLPVTDSRGDLPDAVAPDLPGHGVRGRDSLASMDQVADRLVVDYVGDRRMVVAGYSMGGRLALHLTLRHPARVAGLVMISASAGLRTEAERVARMGLDRDRADALIRDPGAFVRQWYASALFDPLTVDQRSALAMDRLANGRPEPWADALRALSVGVQPWHGDRLREIRVPVSVMAGAVDAKFSTIARQMATMGGFECTIVDGAGHALLFERPDAVASTIANVARAAALP